MKVKLKQAVKMFFKNSSLLMVYFESIANSIDAKATKINLKINIDNKKLKVIIEDNGVGFDDRRYRKFTRLFDVEENTHKGLGRLVYLNYFNKAEITSFFNENQKRKFTFDDNMESDKQIIETIENRGSGSSILLTDCKLERIKKEYKDVNYLKKSILNEFYLLLFENKKNHNDIFINIEVINESHYTMEAISPDDILDLKELAIDTSKNGVLPLYQASLFYYIKTVSKNSESLFISAISIDGRTIKYEIIASENIPEKYQIVFLFLSDQLTGKTSFDRQEINISNEEEKHLKEVFKKEALQILENEIPEINQNKKRIKNALIDKYPHLSIYFQSNQIGYISKEEILKDAHKNFFKDQRELLEAENLSNEQYDKSLQISSMALTEYILFRQLTIEKLINTNSKHKEEEIHNLIALMKNTFNGENSQNDLYRNKAWILDDKYMSYDVVLSDKEMSDTIKYITKEETERDIDRPDLILIFSKDPNDKNPFDVIIVEIKKRGLKVEDNMRAITQLTKRARKLMNYYNNQIQRIWFYAIVEFDEELENELKGEYQELYSTGKMYFKETQIYIKEKDTRIPTSVYVWDINALINDANTRNSTFLNLIKSKFKN